ncbi:carotenoid isomerase [Nitzschia inconspicua]|uniref:Carotenoid isomerase n=1 Tax=Nitzschia inconspicua TaxID=303405 RepID=A0A9K3L358_9STRA|nr:carotenoid isomerase [Nitzschia inconspicua]
MKQEEKEQETEGVEERVVDVIVVGAGIGGLSCAGLTAKYGLSTICLEAHDTPGGVAHSFSRYSTASKDTPFRFDSGPSLITGLSKPSTNPLRQVLDALETADDIVWKTYDGWLIWDYSDGKSIKLTTGDGGDFERAIEEKEGRPSRLAFEAFKEQILKDGGLAEASAYIPPFALRNGNPFWSLVAISRYIGKIITIGTKGLLLTGPFTKTMDLYSLKDPWVRKFFDYLAFALSGVDASNTQGAPIAYMMSDLHRNGAVLDYPMGGMESLIQALVNGMKQQGGELRLNSRVERFLLEEDETSSSVRCVGVELHDGTRIKAKKGVVSNAPLWNYARILRDSVDMNDSTSLKTTVVQSIQDQADSMTMTRSFMHLHLGIPKDGLPEDLECHHSVLNFDHPVTDEQNMSIISIPTVFDSSLAPDGYHIIHAYTAASDSFDDWVPFQKETGKVGANPNSVTSQSYSRKDGYEELKAQKAEALWKAVECIIPDVRERAKRKGSVVLVGSPLTHRRYNQRYRGTYGPGVNPGKDVWELAGATTPIHGLYACGDTSFPGIGLPGVAASGTIAANTIAPIAAQLELMDELKSKGMLQ